MWAKLTTGAALPDSQLVRAQARASSSVVLTDAHVPAIATTPADADRIFITAGAIDVAN
jgi:hydroxybutyrate-dimer hydrolase